MRELSFRETKEIGAIAQKFNIANGKIEWIIPIDSGRINYTYKVVINTGTDTVSYLLQRINSKVFKSPDDVMKNAILVTNHIKSKGKPTLNFISSKFNDSDNKYLYVEEVNGEKRYWRLSEFIHSEVFQSITKKEHMYVLGNVICDFSKSLSDFDARLLQETIPQFHNTRKRFENLLVSVVNKFISTDKHEVSVLARQALKFVIERREQLSIIVSKLENGEIPCRVTHNDPKLNNILFDRKANKPICLIDLDTVMPGTILYDIGDAIRYGANTVSEDTKRYSSASLDMELYCEFIKGCIDAEILTDEEISLIPLAVWTLTMELGIRFLTDYIDGNVYFRAEYENQNLIRAWTQFSLAKDIEERFDEMKQFIYNYKNSKNV